MNADLPAAYTRRPGQSTKKLEITKRGPSRRAALSHCRDAHSSATLFPMSKIDSNISVRATEAVVEFITRASLQAFPSEAVATGKRCIIDGLGVMLAGSTQEASHILRSFVEGGDARAESTAFGTKPFRCSTASAALLNGTSGHALDWDDTQLATSPDRIFGLLTHPTIPPMAASLALGERLGASG